jgi:hypothetical protein
MALTRTRAYKSIGGKNGRSGCPITNDPDLLRGLGTPGMTDRQPQRRGRSGKTNSLFYRQNCPTDGVNLKPQ